jgi:predicted metal-dependent peptidase
MKLTPEQRLQKIHVRMMGHPATLSYSAILMVGDTEVRDDIPTACTNGRDVLYGADFIRSLEDSEIVGLVLHENLHKVYQHHWLWKHLWKENAQLANQAADYVINLEIADMEKKHKGFVKLPDCALLDEGFRGMNTQEVFSKLKEKGGNGGQGGMDEHRFDEISEAECHELSKEIEQAVRQGAMLASKMSGDANRLFGELMRPQVDWREQLREFVSSVSAGKDDSTWARPSRRWLQHDLYMPQSFSETMGAVVVGVDTSGSLGDKELACFLSEIVAICNTVSPTTLHLLEVDAKVQAHTVYDRETFDSLEQKKSFKGGGGTDMCRIFEYVEENKLEPEAIIVLTDGYTPFPNIIKYPTLWAITSEHILAPAGSTIHINT